MFPLFAFTPTESVPFVTNLTYQGVGMFIVLGALGVLAVIVTLVGRVLAVAPVPRAVPAPAVAAAPAAAAAVEAVDPRLHAAIVAAVTVTLGRKARVIAVGTAESNAWSAEGRRTIFQSHKVR